MLNNQSWAQTSVNQPVSHPVTQPVSQPVSQPPVYYQTLSEGAKETSDQPKSDIEPTVETTEIPPVEPTEQKVEILYPEIGGQQETELDVETENESNDDSKNSEESIENQVPFMRIKFFNFCGVSPILHLNHEVVKIVSSFNFPYYYRVRKKIKMKMKFKMRKFLKILTKVQSNRIFFCFIYVWIKGIFFYCLKIFQSSEIKSISGSAFEYHVSWDVQGERLDILKIIE